MSSVQEHGLSVLLEVFEEGAGLWNVDLGLTVLQVHVHLAVLHRLAVRRWVEDVANLLSVAEGRVWYLDVLVIVRVRRGHEELASLETVEVVRDIALFEWVVPDLLGFSGTVDGSCHLVDVRVGVHVLPEGLSVLWVSATAVSLLTTIVVEWDTLSSQGKGECALEHGLVAVVVEEPSIVVIVNEDTKCIHIFEVRLLLLKSVFDSIHGLT